MTRRPRDLPGDAASFSATSCRSRRRRSAGTPSTAPPDIARYGGTIIGAPGDPERLLLLLIATLQGIATLVTSGRAQAEQVGPLITDAVALFTRGQR